MYVVCVAQTFNATVASLHVIGKVFGTRLDASHPLIWNLKPAGPPSGAKTVHVVKHIGAAAQVAIVT